MALIKTAGEIKTLKKGGKILAQVVKEMAHAVRPGVSALELDGLAEKLINKAGGRPSFKGFSDYPSATCISINHEVVHGIPDPQKVLHEGDIVGLDVGLEYRGLFTDMAVTVPVGHISDQAKKLIDITKKALEIGIKEVAPGHTTGHIGQVIEEFVGDSGFSIVRSLVGHGVGHAVHEPPQVPNFGRKGQGQELQTGMVLAIEPMVNAGTHQVITREDGWTVATADRQLSAHFEHTVVVTENGVEIITK